MLSPIELSTSSQDYDFIEYTVVVKLTPDDPSESPSAMRVVGAPRAFYYGPAAGDAGAFRARLHHASCEIGLRIYATHICARASTPRANSAVAACHARPLSFPSPPFAPPCVLRPLLHAPYHAHPAPHTHTPVHA